MVLVRGWPVPIAQESVGTRYGPTFFGEVPWKRRSVISKIQRLNTLWQRREGANLGREPPLSFKDVQSSQQQQVLPTSGVHRNSPSRQLIRGKML